MRLYHKTGQTGPIVLVPGSFYRKGGIWNKKKSAEMYFLLAYLTEQAIYIYVFVVYISEFYLMEMSSFIKISTAFKIICSN